MKNAQLYASINYERRTPLLTSFHAASRGGEVKRVITYAWTFNPCFNTIYIGWLELKTSHFIAY